jgi:hypothetical protein
MFNLHQQYLDTATGFHVIELRDDRGNRHVVQLAVGHDACPSCGAIYPKDQLDTLDPEAAIRQVTEMLNTSQQQVLRYAVKHGLKVK